VEKQCINPREFLFMAQTMGDWRRYLRIVASSSLIEGLRAERPLGVAFGLLKDQSCIDIIAVLI
jgi:hypothetical protein